MKPNEAFLQQPKQFWAYVRTVGEQAGYTVRGEGRIMVPSLDDIASALEGLGLDASHVCDNAGRPTDFGESLQAYFEYRADVLDNHVAPRLMDGERAKQVFKEHKSRLCSTCPIPMNKQRGKKRAPAYFTGIINMLIEANANGLPCDYNPRQLTTVTRSKIPVRTLARWVDGAFPSPVNPVAVWEIKEYYYTTTFGSRVADGIYESLLDGMELEELQEHEGIEVKHYLMLDAHYTWWECGRSYLCRVVDMLHMGYVDEVLFGYEVVEELPRIVGEWVSMVRSREQ